MLHTQEVTGSSPVPPTIDRDSPASNCSQKFTKELLQKFLSSRPQGISPKTITLYHYALDRFIGYTLSPEGINSYLNSLSCRNGKHNYYRCIKTLCHWLHRGGYLSVNPVEYVSPPRRQKKLLPAIGKEQLDTILAHCHCERDKVVLNLLWYSGMRLSEAANVKAKDFDWQEGTVVVLGKGNRYRKALAGNGIVKEWFSTHDSLEISRAGIATMLKRLSKETDIRCNPHSFRRGFAIHNLKSGLSTRIVQSLGGWDTITMVERYSRSLSFEDALSVYHSVNSPNGTHD